MIEAGLPRLGVTNWYALEAPPRLAPALVSRLNTALRNSLADPELARQLIGMGYEVAPSSPEALRARITAEYELWRGVIKGLKIEQ